MNIRPEFDISNIQTPKLCLIACGVSNQAASCAVSKHMQKSCRSIVASTVRSRIDRQGQGSSPYSIWEQICSANLHPTHCRFNVRPHNSNLLNVWAFCALEHPGFSSHRQHYRTARSFRTHVISCTGAEYHAS